MNYYDLITDVKNLQILITLHAKHFLYRKNETILERVDLIDPLMVKRCVYQNKISTVPSKEGNLPGSPCATSRSYQSIRR